MTEAEVIRVMIVDDYDILRNGVAVSLRMFPDIQLVAEAATGDEAIRMCDQVPIDVILMDLVMPGTNGVTAIREIHARHPEIRIIALTSYDNEEYVEQAIHGGAISYLLKNLSAHELADAIRMAHKGQSVLAKEASQALVNATRRPSTDSLKLTPREREVLRLMVKGASNSEIARALTVSESTAKKHVSNVLIKLNVSSRTEAVAFALQNRIASDKP